jgi:hypothetical protein
LNLRKNKSNEKHVANGLPAGIHFGIQCVEKHNCFSTWWQDALRSWKQRHEVTRILGDADFGPLWHSIGYFHHHLTAILRLRRVPMNDQNPDSNSQGEGQRKRSDVFVVIPSMGCNASDGLCKVNANTTTVSTNNVFVRHSKAGCLLSHLRPPVVRECGKGKRDCPIEAVSVTSNISLFEMLVNKNWISSPTQNVVHNVALVNTIVEPVTWHSSWQLECFGLVARNVSAR